MHFLTNATKSQRLPQPLETQNKSSNLLFFAFLVILFRNDHAVASFQVGLGVKTEGSLTIAGTKGYVYVPAPWWKTDYFEVRYEDQNYNKKYFYPYVGEGLRYEIKDFVAAILTDGYYFSKVSKEENLMMAEVQEIYILGKNVYKL